MQIIRAKDAQDMGRKAAAILFAQVTAKPDSVLGLATGSTPVGLYKQLIEWYKAGDLDFSRCSSANLDEYVGLENDHDQSYAWFMRHHLFDHINLPVQARHIPSGTAEDGEAECRRYDRVLKSLGGIDLQLLGIGHDGHIGFNEPDDHFPAGTHRVDLTAETIAANARFFASEAQVPRRAYTMGVGTIMAARRVLLCACGADKAEILAKALFGPVTPRVPASILQFHSDLVVVADQAAAACFPREA